MINKDLDLLLLSKLLPNNDDSSLIIPIKLKNESQIKPIEFINSDSISTDRFKDYFNTVYLVFSGGLNVAKVLYISTNGSIATYFKHHTYVSINSIKGLLNNEGRIGAFVSTPFSNIILNTIRRDHVEDLLQRLDASITIVNNPWITSLRDTLKDLAEIMRSNNLTEIDISSLAEYCVLDLIKESTDENKKVEKLLKMIYG